MTRNPFNARWNRRAILRGLGAVVALPALESLRPTLALASEAAPKLAQTASGAPLRTAFIFFPNGAIPGAWQPKGDGADFEFGATLEPLADLKSTLQVMRGLDHQNATAGRDGGGDHARGNGVFLTGTRLKKSDTDIQAGISIDQAIANKVGQETRFPSLELTCDATRQIAGCDSGYSCAYQYNLSWSSPTTPVAAESNPRLVFERLFGSGAPGERAAGLQRRMHEQRSILDFVLDDAKKMQKRLGAKDQNKLDEYLTSVREIEARIAKAERFGKTPDPSIETPAGIPTSYTEYVNTMYDLLLLAFQTDQTRVATFCLSHDGSNRSFSEIGIVEGHHDLSHHQNNADRIEKVAKIDRWYVEQFAKFLRKMNEQKDVDGKSLLHNSQIVYGGGNADGNRHTHDDLPVLLAGNGGGTLTPGRHAKFGGKPMCNLFLSMADRMGVANLPAFGDSTGRLENV
jgi:hypothetical protein